MDEVGANPRQEIEALTSCFLLPAHSTSRPTDRKRAHPQRGPAKTEPCCDCARQNLSVGLPGWCGHPARLAPAGLGHPAPGAL